MTYQQHLNILKSLNVILHTISDKTDTRILLRTLEEDRQDVLLASISSPATAPAT